MLEDPHHKLKRLSAHLAETVSSKQRNTNLLLKEDMKAQGCQSCLSDLSIGITTCITFACKNIDITNASMTTDAYITHSAFNHAPSTTLSNI